MHEALIALLRLAGGAAAEQIGWDWPDARSGVWPRITLTDLSQQAGYTLDGQNGVHFGAVQVDCWAIGRADALAIGRAVQGHMSGYSGTVAGVRFRSVLITATQLNGEVPNDSDVVVGRYRIDLRIKWEVPV
jgi:Na+-translocating ferredoxin:NAD+ oxidoreductase RnfE subunit